MYDKINYVWCGGPAEQDLAPPDEEAMYYVYVLKSTINGDIYIGYSEDLRIRIRAHNLGKVKSTRAYKPWDLVYYEAYGRKRDATKREKQLKNHKAKIDLRDQIKYSLEL